MGFASLNPSYEPVRGGGASEPISPLVIPGRAPWRGPGIHTPDRGYGFRARRFASSRNDGGLFLHIIERHAPQPEREVGLEMQRGDHFAHRQFGHIAERVREQT